MKSFWFYLAAVAFLSSCASQVAPTGGEKDLKPPEVVRTSPENLSVHFTAERIVISFDEYIQLHDANNQIFFSPALLLTPDYRLRGKNLIIHLKEALRDDVTYSINFGGALKDITEGNTLYRFQYVFSTGSSIDSLRIQGKLTEAATGKVQPNQLLMLYRDLSDSVVARSRPDYITRTDSSGNFVLNYLQAGTYKLFALDDQNNNLLFDQPSEQTAFVDAPVAVSDTSLFFNLYLFGQAAVKQKLLNAYSFQPGKVSFALAKGSRNMDIISGTAGLRMAREKNAAGDTITVWTNDQTSDSLLFFLHDGDFSDTVKVRMKKVEEGRKTAPGPGLTVQLKSFAGGMVKHNEPLVLKFSSPVTDLYASTLFLIEDTLPDPVPIIFRMVQDSITLSKHAVLEPRLKAGTKYSILIPDSVFAGIAGFRNDSTTLHFTTFLEEDLGNLNLDFRFADSTSSISYFFEFISSDGSVTIKSKLPPGSGIYRFNGLPPGAYRLKVVEDRNDNLLWDTGNYWYKLQPERIFFYAANITIRANWDVDVLFKIQNE